ncbi:DUF3500 domain-containing protein [Actinoplanes sichuanensis]|uniref:DUF3500 domain-containing protein n=1 Tax=Actinoplanes sichuanensis TaxID=512349 RepID=A0ABW4ADQ1_9ACTN|nr:DUF3500 domain-containing protein [Actinoplanes sichuanensis]BEL10140.1 DUF3500 domain-containing protein [Actinoplanes sichuanensis]
MKLKTRWRGAVTVAAAVALVGAGIATANASTADKGTGPTRTNAIKDPTGGRTGLPGLVNAANAFLATLSDDQKAEVLLEFTEENATAWSNLPCAGTCRPGIELGSLTEEQLAAADAVLRAAAGTGQGTGFDQLQDIVAADDILAADSSGSVGGGAPPTSTDPSAAPSADASAAPAPSGSAGGPPAGGGGMTLTYGSGYYYLAFLGTPSVDGTWQLDFGGHHLATHLTYTKGRAVGASPFFIGVEPISYTDESGATVESMRAQKTAMAALTASLTEKQLATATLDQSFGDVLVGPGEDGQFPETKVGISVKSLTPKQKKLVLAAIKPWVANADDATTQQLLKIYEKELDQTFVALSGGTALDTHGDYVRIDGPSVWVEFICQTGVVYNDQIHYHTVYRDHTRDYGGEFDF